MSYDTIEAAMETLLLSIDAFRAEEKNVSRGDWRVLHGGVVAAAILEYNGVRIDYETQGGGTRFTWMPRVHLYGRYQLEDTVHATLRDRRQEIIDKFLAYPQLNGTTGVLDAHPVRGGWNDPQEIELGGVTFLHEYIDLEVQEVVNVTLKE